jgi:MFS family permease
MLTTYRDVLSRPGAVLFTVTAALSRLPLSMAGLGLVLLVHERTGSYARAGVVAAVYVLAAAVTAPFQGRLADRLGQDRVLWVVGTVYAAGMALTLVAVESSWPAGWWYVSAGLAGLAAPQTGSMVRARWSHVITDRRQLNTAFSIEAVLDEAVFVLGPVLVTFLTISVHEVAGLVFAATAAAVGSWALALQRGTQPPPVTVTKGDRPPMGRGVLAPVVVVSAGLGVLFGSTEVIVVGYATEAGHRGAAGAVLAVFAAGSLLAGVAVGALPAARDPLRRMRWGLIALGVLFVPLLFVVGLPWLVVGMFVAGAAISPTLIASVNLIERWVPPGRLTEALTWSTTGIAVGVAPGTALAGWVVDEHGGSAGFVVPLVAAAAAVAATWAVRRPAEAKSAVISDPRYH